MKIVVQGNMVDLCKSCEKDYECCDAYDDDYLYGDDNSGICCCSRYIPLKTREGGESCGE